MANDIEIKIGASTAGLTTGLNGAKRSINNFSKVATTSSAMMTRNIGESMRKMGNTLVGAAGAAMIGFVLPIVNGFKEIIEVGKQAEDSLQRILSVFNDIETPQAFTQLKDDLEGFVAGLAGQTKYDFNEISESMYTMAQSGKSANEILSLTPEILKLATAQMADIDSTAQLTISTMNGYNMMLDDSSRVTNALAAATTNTMLRLNDLTTSSRYVNATLGALWGEEVFERGLALTGMLRNWGRTGMQSGRIIRDVFQSLLNPTAEVARIMERNNINIYKNSDAINKLKKEYESAEKVLSDMELSGDATSDMIYDQKAIVEELGYTLENTYATGLKDLDTVLDEFAKAREAGLTAGEMFAIGGKQSGGAFMQLLDNIDTYKELTASITGTNEAERQYEVQTQTLAYQLDILRSTMVEVKRQLYESIKEPLMIIVKQLIASKDAVIEFGKIFFEVFADKLKIVADAIVNIIKRFNELSDSNKKLIGGFVGTAAAIGLVVAPLFLMTGILLWNTAAIVDGVAALMRYSGKITGLIKTQGLLNGILAKTTTGYIHNKIILKSLNKELSFKQKIISFIAIKLGYYKKAIQTSIVYTKLLAVYTRITTFSLRTFAKTLWTETIPAIGATLLTMAPFIAASIAITAAMVVLYVAVRDNWGGIADVVKNSVGYILDAIKPLTDAVYNVIGTLTGLFDAFKSGTEMDIMEAIGSVLGGIVNLIISIPKTIFNSLAKIIGTVSGIIGKWFADIANDVSKKGLARFITDLVNAIIKGAWDMGKSFIEGFMKGVRSEKTEAGKEIVDNIVLDGLFKKSGEESGDEFIEGFEESVEGYDFKGLTDKIKTTGKGIDLFSDMITFEGGISKDEDVLMQIGQKIADEYGDDIPENLQTAMKDAMKDDNPIQFIFDWIHENMPKYSGMLSDYYKEEVEEILKETENVNYGKAVDILLKKGMTFSKFTSDDTEMVKIVAQNLADNSGEMSDGVATYISEEKLTLDGLKKAVEDEAAIIKEITEQKAANNKAMVELHVAEQIKTKISGYEADILEKQKELAIAEEIIASGGLSEIEYAKNAEGKTSELIDIVNRDNKNAIAVVKAKEDKIKINDEIIALEKKISNYETGMTTTFSPTLLTEAGKTPTAKTPIGQLVEDGVTEATGISEDKMPEIGKKLVTDMSDGIALAQPNLDTELQIIKSMVNTTFDDLVLQSFDWGSSFMQNLVAGIRSQMTYFSSAMANIRSEMTGLNFLANPETATNASLLTSLNALNTNVAALGGTSGGMNITININGNEFGKGSELDENMVSSMVKTGVSNAFNKYNRTSVI